jgi:glycine/D-amino acid oxidase-like deaminating enzyme/nitrite reductase/ring-hydroxylating ferredoxin subunit
MASRSSTHADTLPLWTDSADFPKFDKLNRDLDTDVVIVGAGITGLTAAYLLARAGRSVVILDRARCAQIDTGHTTAHVTMVTDDRLTDLESRFGRPHAQAVWDAGLAAMMQIDAIVHERAIDCSLESVDGYLHAPDGAKGDADSFRAEAALASELGFDATFVADVPFVGGPGICFDNQRRFHPRRYLAGLAQAIVQLGGSIFEDSNADEFFDAPLGVRSNDHIVRCQDIVIATHNPLVGNVGMASATFFQTKLALYTSYVVAGRVPGGLIPDALYWDTADPYRYLRLERQGNETFVIYGGEDHKTGQTTDTNACYERLERSLQERIPEVKLSHRWSGQVIETPDGLPYIGRMTDHQYAATGFAGNGMTFGTVAAMMMADAISGAKNPWTDLFDIDRKALGRGLWEYLKENSDYPYYLLRDRFAGAEGRSVRAVKRGQGKIVDRNGKKMAASRDDKGRLTILDATCTHMGCVVAWNSAERTWDCPCHGSRFSAQGEVISGPAEAPLEEPAKE